MEFKPMKKLSDYEGPEGIEKAAEVFPYIMAVLMDEKNQELKNEENPLKLYSGFMRNTPDKMQSIFAVLSDEDPETYSCNGSNALLNIMVLLNDDVMKGLFLSQRQKRDATASGSASEKTE